MPSDPGQAAIIERGRYLTVAGDCLPCHSVQGQPPFSGGLAVGSPVGAVYSPNITPDKTYGIGNYTDQQFWNVLHNGIAPGSSLLVFPKYLYPSMPYDAYSKLSYSDVMAIKAYLMSLPAAAVPDRRTQIPFPLNTRAALLGWRMLFFSAQPVQYDASWSPQVRNGAFLVQALEHCSDFVWVGGVKVSRGRAYSGAELVRAQHFVRAGWGWSVAAGGAAELSA
jgi:mono/diheme cytochrome c family protein